MSVLPESVSIAPRCLSWVRRRFPDVDEQTELYARVMDLADEKPVIFRTLDLGGDKVLPYLPRQRESNPAMGWRSIRFSLDEESIFRDQLRALVRAARGRPLNVLFPLISEVAEFEAASKILRREVRLIEESGAPAPAKLAIGAMLEVPSLVWQLPALLPRVDFLSIGSNDLLQFLFAADRDNSRMAERYDVLSPAALTVFHTIFQQANEARVPVTFCGELAGAPLEAMALIGLGCRAISTQPGAIGSIRAMTRSLTLAPLEDFMQEVLALPDHSVRSHLADYASKAGLDL